MFKRILSFVLIVTILLSIPLIEGVAASSEDWFSSGDTTGWTAAYPNNDQNDYLRDQQTGSGSVSQDIVGSAEYPSAYIHFSSSEVAFRIRVNSIDGNSSYEFKNFAFVGIDADCNGSVDFFLGAYNPTGNTGRIGIYSAASGCANTSPNTTGISGKPLMAFKPEPNVNYSIAQATDGSNLSGGSGEDPDYFISFKFSLLDIASALNGTSYTFTPTTPFRFMTGTAAQDNSFNQDLNGMDRNGWSSGSTWNSLGVFSNAVTAADGFTSSYCTVVFDKNTGDTEPSPAFKVISSGNVLGALPAAPTKKGGFTFAGWNTKPDGTGTAVDVNTVIANSMTVYAVWSSSAVYTVTFYSPNSTTVYATAKTINGIVGPNFPQSPTTPPDGTNTNFIGWSQSSSNTTNMFDASTTVTGNMNVYAVWNSSVKTPVRFYDDTSLVAAIYPNGNSSNYNTNSPTPLKVGWVFKWWCSTPGGSTNNLSGGTKIGNSPSVFNYYAVWEAANISYTVHFNANLGSDPTTASGIPSDRTVTDGYFGAMSTAPTREGYVFVEWNKSTTGTGEAMYPTSVISANTNVYAIWKQIQTVTFNANGGTFDGSMETLSLNIFNGALLGLPQPPSLNNNTFLGWSTSNDSSTVDFDLYGNTFTSGQTLYAVWSPDYTITFDTNGGAWSDDSTSMLVGTAYGSVLYMPEVPAMTGYTFAGWNTKADGTGMMLTMTTNITDDIDVYAKWTANTYTISYHLDSGTNQSGAPTMYTYDTITTLPTPTKSGNAFEGWYVDSEFGGSPVTEIGNADIGNKTYYAKWTPYDFTITFEPNGGTNPYATLAGYVSGKAVALPTPTKIGSIFAGWYEDSEFGGSPVTEISDTDTGNKTFYAKWTTTNTYGITYELNGGTNNEINPDMYTEGVRLTLADPEKTGHTFGGWYEEDAFSGSQILSISTEDTGDKVYYAKWTANTYNVVYTLNGGINSDSNPAAYIYGNELQLEDPIRSGYDFGGWYTAANFSGSPVSSISTTDMGDKAFYAKWTANTYNITYTLNGGTNSGSNSATYTYGIGLTLAAPSKTGHSFGGWYTAANFSGSPVSSISTTDIGDKAFYAKWTVNTYHVTLDANGGSGGTSSVTAAYEQSMPAATAPTRNGQTFNGYFDAQNGGIQYYTSNMSSAKNWDKTAADVTLYAQWTTDNSYNVTGSVIDEDTNPISGAAVLLKRGNTQYGTSATTAADGNFSIYNVPAGIYNLFITKGDKVITYEVTVGPGSTSFDNVALPLGNASSNLVVSGGTPAVIVDNLQSEAVGKWTDTVYSNPALSGASLKIEMTVEKTDENTNVQDTADQIADISQLAQNNRTTVGLYLNISVDQYINTVGSWNYDQNIPETSNRIKLIIPIPEELQGKSSYRVYRYHINSVTEIGTDPAQDEYMVLDRTNWMLTLYVNKFSVYAIAYTEASGGGSGGLGTAASTYQITKSTAVHGSITLSASRASAGTTVTVTPTPDTGYMLGSLSIRDNKGNTVAYASSGSGSYSFTMLASDVTVTASFVRKPFDPAGTGVASVLETRDHIRYLNGYPNGSVRPENNMTRAEASQMFYNLLLDKDVAIMVSFSDVKTGAWYANAVNTLASMGIITGYSDGSYNPDKRITREQFVTMAARFAKNLPTRFTSSFTDVSSQRWSYSSILATVEMGWINGYNDSTFKPGSYITRAEIAAIVNNMLYRSADRNWVDSHATGLRQFNDLTDNSKWYYYTMREATDPHDYSRSSDENETWSNLE